MTREIKFRGMDIKGNWYYGNLSILTGKINHVEAGTYISNSVGLPFAYQIRPETVGQYTGLKDKNGKEIYEGDFVMLAQCGFSEIIFHNGSFIFAEMMPLELSSCEPEILKILGNIYENPELLKEPTK